MLKSERFSTYSHLFGAILFSILGLSVAYSARDNSMDAVVAFLTCLSAVFSMGSSAFYHSHKQGENEINWRRKLDHIAIFFGIAGFISGLSYFLLESPWQEIIIGIQITELIQILIQGQIIEQM